MVVEGPKWAARHRKITHFIINRNVVEAGELNERVREILEDKPPRDSDDEPMEVDDALIKRELKAVRDHLEKQCGLTLKSVQKTGVQKKLVGKKKGKRKRKKSISDTATYFAIVAQTQDDVNKLRGNYLNEIERHFLKALLPLINECDDGFSRARALSVRSEMPEDLRKKMDERKANALFEKLLGEQILEEKNNSLYPGLRFEIAFDQESIKSMEMPGLEDAESDDFAE